MTCGGIVRGERGSRADVFRLVSVTGPALTAALGAALAWRVSAWWWLLAVVAAAMTAVAVRDVVQREHSVLRNYPLLGHLRFLLEALRPELQQYFIERNYDGRPYDRDVRSIVYERAKGVDAEEPFGTERDVGAAGYEFLVPSLVPRPHRTSRPPSGSAGRTVPSPMTWRC